RSRSHCHPEERTPMPSVELNGPAVERQDDVLTPAALDFVAALHRRFAGRRDELLAARAERREQVRRTGRLDFDPETKAVRDGEWPVAPAPPDLLDRRVEITGPTERKMATQAPNSGPPGGAGAA